MLTTGSLEAGAHADAQVSLREVDLPLLLVDISKAQLAVVLGDKSDKLTKRVSRHHDWGGIGGIER